ncbi:MAG: PPC domain-containing DNA-binding protein [Halobacteriaceae archaeon]
MDYREVTPAREAVARLDHGADWRSELEALASALDAEAAWFTAIGAVEDAELWYYDQDELEYEAVTFEEPLEVAACVGNVSWLEDERFAHTHAVLSRRSGQTLAGHLNRATVFAGEAHMRSFETPLERSHEEVTDLDLWL